MDDREFLLLQINVLAEMLYLTYNNCYSEEINEKLPWAERRKMSADDWEQWAIKIADERWENE